MGRRPDLSDEEEAAFKAELERLIAEETSRLGTSWGALRAVGMALGFERASAQSQVSAARNARIGAGMADRICAYLGVSRTEFLRSKGVLPTFTVMERVFRTAASLNLSAVEAVVVAEELKGSDDVDDVEIVSRFRRAQERATIHPLAEKLALVTGKSLMPAPQDPSGHENPPEEPGPSTQPSARRRRP